VYAEKDEEKSPSEKELVTNESRSKESAQTHESASVVVKKMKFMGRSKKDNKIKTISCLLTETEGEC
jgi:hypothetical protein